MHAFPAGPIHIHAAEQSRRWRSAWRGAGARPVQWLLDNMPVDERWCLIHCTHITPRRPAPRPLRRGGRLVPDHRGQPRRRHLRRHRFLAAGGRFAVGTDSNVRIAAAEELRTLEYGQRLRGRPQPAGRSHASTGRTLHDAACSGGTQALGMTPATALAPGQCADIVVLDADDPALIGRSDDAALDAWIFAAGAARAPRARRRPPRRQRRPAYPRRCRFVRAMRPPPAACCRASDTSEPKFSPVIPEAERSEAIRDLHQRVELTRSRIGALLAQALASLRPG